ncbi:hypothetical protein IJJ37_03240 [Candidatus Saccharibacteria bacterium]|nr:hypothetical protein [Candidatus Saccharibacteria bacterium]
MFKKAWGCLWKKVRLQKCETGFKEDVKNTILSRVIVKHPKWVKPLSVVIEVISVVIVVVAVWALLTAVKSLLALWALGSCNVTKPSACSMGAEVCSIDQSEPTNVFEATGRWFEEWGEIFEAIPEKFKTYDAASYNFNYVTVSGSTDVEKPIAVDILDPGCSVCMRSYQNQKAAGFFDQYDVRLVPFAIQDADNTYKFPNSATVVKYMLAVEQFRSGTAIRLLDRLFTEKDDDGINYFNRFNEDYSEAETVATIETWLQDFGLNSKEVAAVREIVSYPEIEAKMSENREIVENEIRVRGIPTMIYDGAKHTGLWKQ